MSLFSSLLKNVVPDSPLDAPLAVFGASEIERRLDAARTQGRAAVVRAVTIPFSDLQRIAPHVDPAALQAAEARIAEAEADMAMLVVGAPAGEA